MQASLLNLLQTQSVSCQIQGTRSHRLRARDRDPGPDRKFAPPPFNVSHHMTLPPAKLDMTKPTDPCVCLKPRPRSPGMTARQHWEPDDPGTPSEVLQLNWVQSLFLGPTVCLVEGQALHVVGASIPPPNHHETNNTNKRCGRDESPDGPHWG